MDDELNRECNECGLRYMVVFALDAVGHWGAGYCPRCGCEDVTICEFQDEEPTQ